MTRQDISGLPVASCYNLSMLPSALPISELIATADYWTACGETGFTAHLTYSKSGQQYQAVHSVPTSELAQLHPLLPNLLRKVLADARRERMPEKILGEHMQPTLDILTGNFVEFIDTSGYERIVSCLSNLVLVFRTDNRVLMTGGTHTVASVEVDGQELRFVVATRRVDTVVMKDELEARYPGWEKRWHVATELGVDLKDMLPHLFPSQTRPVKSSDLHGVNFE